MPDLKGPAKDEVVDFFTLCPRNESMAMVHTESIGRYRVVGTLGQGAMGRVYLADDPGLGMKVAIKLIKRDNMLENEVILARFRREAVLGARIRHPNIVGIYDVGQDINHGPYMVMEYVDGRELADILKEGSATTAEKLDWLRQTSEALRCAHEGGIVHRDVKPANILVSRDGQAKLIDFGVAKVMGSEISIQRFSSGATQPMKVGVETPSTLPEAELLTDKYATAWGLLSVAGAHGSDEAHLELLSSGGGQGDQQQDSVSGNGNGQQNQQDMQHEGLTQMGALIGTPSYTAPELLNGQGPSPQTDDFAFAVTAFQTLLGQLPFKGAGTRDTLEQIRSGVVQFPVALDARLHGVFDKALAYDPQNRYADLNAFVSDLYLACGKEMPAPDVKKPVSTSRSSLSGILPVHHVIPWVKWIGGGLAVLLVLGFGLDRWLASSSGLEEITVHTEPPGASIYVNGIYLGQAPVDRISLSEPGHSLKVVKRHYRTVDRSLTPEDGFVSLLLELAPYGLKVETEPPGAEIRLDGKHVGTSPTYLKRVQGKGEHSLELRLEGFLPKVIKLDPLRPQREPIRLDPEPSADSR
jgi:serine/threonine protein kinase